MKEPRVRFRTTAPGCLVATVILFLATTAEAAETGWARAMPSIGVTLGLAMPSRDSYLELTPGLAVGVKFQIGDREHWPLAPYFFLISSKHQLETLKPYETLLGDAANDYRIEPDVRLDLLNGDTRVTTYGVGVGYLIVEDSWIQPYVDVGLGGGGISFSGGTVEKKRYGGGAVALHVAAGVDFFLWRGFALGLDLRSYHVFTDNPFRRSLSAGRGLTMTCLAATLKYWDR